MKRPSDSKLWPRLAIVSAGSTLCLGFGWADISLWLEFAARIERLLVA